MDPMAELFTMIKGIQEVVSLTSDLPLQIQQNLAKQFRGKLIGIKTNLEYFCIGANIHIDKGLFRQPIQSTSDNFSRKESFVQQNNSSGQDIQDKRECQYDQIVDKRDYQNDIDAVDKLIEKHESRDKKDLTMNVKKSVDARSTVEKYDTSSPTSSSPHSNFFASNCDPRMPTLIKDFEQFKQKQQKFNSYFNDKSPRSKAAFVSQLRQKKQQESQRDIHTSNSFQALSDLDDLEDSDGNFQQHFCDTFKD